MIKILITNIGRRTYFVRYLEELIKLKYPIKVYLSDASKNTAGFYINKKFKKVIFPRVNKSEKKYIMFLKSFCKKEKINLVIPLIDSDLNIQEEIGDVLFSVVNISRFLSYPAEDMLRKTNIKFEERFKVIEKVLEKRGKRLKDASLAEMEEIWEMAKIK